MGRGLAPARVTTGVLRTALGISQQSVHQPFRNRGSASRLRTRICRLRVAHSSLRGITRMSMCWLYRRAAYWGTMPTPTRASTILHSDSKLPTRICVLIVLSSACAACLRKRNKADPSTSPTWLKLRVSANLTFCVWPGGEPWRHEDEAIFAVRHSQQALGTDAASDNADLRSPFGHRTDDTGAQLLAQIHADIRVGGQERRQNAWQELRDRGGVGQHADMTPDAFRVFPQVVLQLLGVQQYQAAVVQERLPCRRQRHATVLRSRSLVCSRSSMFLILRLADGGVMFERSAPRVRLFISATSTNSLMSMRSNSTGAL